MRLVQLQVQNFRGIKSLDWNLPRTGRLVTLIGPGDSGKSTILEAIHYLLGDRWNVPFSDVDFYNLDVSSEIRIQAVVVDPPDELLRDDAFGLMLSGIDEIGGIHHDPLDGDAICLIVALTVGPDLEPKWTIERAGAADESRPLSSGRRRKFSTFKVDSRTDAQLRWSRTSALGRISAIDGSERDALAAASRAARAALGEHEGEALNRLAGKIQDRANRVGSGRFKDLKAGLDTSRSGQGAALALHEGDIPLMSFGLGSRRLASLAAQQVAAEGRAIAVVDEVEEGLEPHRVIGLLNYLEGDDSYEQVIVTTHSPVAVEQAPSSSLCIVQNRSGNLSVEMFQIDDKRPNAMRRDRPSSFLARRILVLEGNTEFGVALEVIDHWDAKRKEVGLSVSAGEGLALQPNVGGSEVAPRVEALRRLGYESVGLMDNDDRQVDKAVLTAIAKGASIYRWTLGMCTEAQVVSELDAHSLSEFLGLGVKLRSAESTVLDDLNADQSVGRITSLNVDSWTRGGMDLSEARERIWKTAVRRQWFKNVEAGRRLGSWLVERESSATVASTWTVLNGIHGFIYGGLDETRAEIVNDG